MIDLRKPGIMLDLETMSTQHDAAITSIGAVRFDEIGIINRFSADVSLQSSIDYGLRVDADTVLWWMGRSDEAREQFQRPTIPLDRALMDFATWIGDDDAKVWGNGSDFDNVIMESAYQACGIEQPWHGKNNRCYRTIRDQFSDLDFVRIGVSHLAVDDAESQAIHLIKCSEAL